MTRAAIPMPGEGNQQPALKDLLFDRSVEVLRIRGSAVAARELFKRAADPNCHKADQCRGECLQAGEFLAESIIADLQELHRTLDELGLEASRLADLTRASVEV